MEIIIIYFGLDRYRINKISKKIMGVVWPFVLVTRNRADFSNQVKRFVFVMLLITGKLV